MDGNFKEKIRQKLYDLKADVLESLIVEKNDLRAAVEDTGVKDLADVASNGTDARTLEAVSAKDKVRLQSIESALVRLENGRFGTCARCGTKIGQARLEAIPYVVMCVDCKASTEKQPPN